MTDKTPKSSYHDHDRLAAWKAAVPADPGAARSFGTIGHVAPPGFGPMTDAYRGVAGPGAATAGPADNWHELKTDPAAFDAVAAGLKTYEIRKDDRCFKVGDGLRLLKTRFAGSQMNRGFPLEYTGDVERRVISHILCGAIYGLAEGWCILSFAAPSTGAAADRVDERAAFEAWDRKVYALPDDKYSYDGIDFRSFAVQGRWLAWQERAARSQAQQGKP